jgi:2-amino-4-deoxychorismate synthase
LFGREERVGFYNTFTGKIRRPYPDLELMVADHSDELLAVRGEFFIGFQFHPESILTKNGDAILKEAVEYLLGRT